MEFLFATILIAAVGVPSTAASRASDAITGLSASGSQDGRVEIHRCDPSLCRKIVDAAPLRTNPGLRDGNSPDRGLRGRRLKGQIGRASCRERGCQDVELAVVRCAFKKKHRE